MMQKQPDSTKRVMLSIKNRDNDRFMRGVKKAQERQVKIKDVISGTKKRLPVIADNADTSKVIQ